MTSATSTGADNPLVRDPQLVHIGRQPIYDRADEVVGYELLFRGAAHAIEADRRSAYATSQVIVNAFAEFGLDQLVGDRPCFLNMTREFLVGHLPLPFPPDRVVLEVLESVAIDDEVLAGVTALANQGFQIALDDFVWGQGHERLLGLASYVKIDMLECDPPTVVSTVGEVRRHSQIKLVAERIETTEVQELAQSFGFDLFQGYVYGRPQTLSAVSMNPSRMRRLELFGALTASDLEMAHVVQIVTADPALSYRVLQATNSAATGLPRKVASVDDAIMILGIDRIRQWAALMLVSDISEASEEQLATMMSRARLCQIVAERLDAAPDAAFTVGLLSGVSDLVTGSMGDLIGRLPMTVDIRNALTDGTGRLGQVLAMVKAYESRDLGALVGAPVSSSELARSYLEAVGWSVRTVGGVMGGQAVRRLPPAERVHR